MPERYWIMNSTTESRTLEIPIHTDRRVRFPNDMACELRDSNGMAVADIAAFMKTRIEQMATWLEDRYD